MAGSCAFEGEIPILDFGDALRRGAGAGRAGGGSEELARQLAWACEHVGFYFLRGAEEALLLLPRLFECNKRLHRLPKPTLLAMDIEKNRGRFGYKLASESGAQAGDSAASDEEELALGNKATFRRFAISTLAIGTGHGRGFADQTLPPELEEGIPGFSQTMEEYLAAVGRLTRAMLPVYAKALGMPEAELLALFQQPRHLLGLNHYPPRPRGGEESEREEPEDDDEYNGIAMHADFDFFTVLARQDRVPGLRLMLPSGEWAEAPPDPEGCLLVNTGEFLSRLTNGRWLNTVHKVVPPRDRERHSVGCFLYQDRDTLLAPLPQFCSEANPAAYEPFTYRSIMSSGETPYTVGARAKEARLGVRSDAGANRPQSRL